MKHDSQLATKINAGEFIVTAELLPQASAKMAEVEAATGSLKNGLCAVNIADNPEGPILSSLAGALALIKAGIEPVYQIVTRDRNRIAIQSDLMGAAALGIRNVLCLSGHHQALTDSSQSANVYDIDSIQLIAAVKKMRDENLLINGTSVNGDFPMLIGAVASPDMLPLELNILRLAKKIEAGADFIQTQAVFDVETFGLWLEQARNDGLTEKTAIIAGVMPLTSADEAQTLKNKYTDLVIPDNVIQQLNESGDEEKQKEKGLLMCVETIKAIKKIQGVKGVHILSGGKEDMVPDIIAQSEL